MMEFPVGEGGEVKSFLRATSSGQDLRSELLLV